MSQELPREIVCYGPELHEWLAKIESSPCYVATLEYSSKHRSQYTLKLALKAPPKAAPVDNQLGLL